MGLPTLDFSEFSRGGGTGQEDVVRSMMESFKTYGAVRLVNHGIPAATINSIFQLSQLFFNIPIEARKKISNTRDDTPQRGWSFVGSEQTSKLNMKDEGGKAPADLSDVKEHFDWVIGDDKEYPNKWPAEEDLPGFRVAIDEFAELCHKLGIQVLEAMDIGLRLPQGTLSDRCDVPVTEARLNHYSPILSSSLSNGKAQRAWPHTDFGLITLLFQDSAGGLEVEDLANPGTFIPVIREDPIEVAVYISDTLESLTNGLLRATLHQVATPISMKDNQKGVLPERYSVASFVKATRDTTTRPLSQFVDSDNPEKYTPMTAIELHRKRVGQLYVD